MVINLETIITLRNTNEIMILEIVNKLDVNFLGENGEISKRNNSFKLQI